MRLLLIRHGDPDYRLDSLTEQGFREAKAFAACADELGIDELCVSPLGRARDTARFTAEKLGMRPTELDWLREFPAVIDLDACPQELRQAYGEHTFTEFRGAKRILWDMLPGYLAAHPELLDPEGWKRSDAAKHSDILAVWEHVTGEFERFLAERGYVREGAVFRVEHPSRRTAALFCHFGVSCALLAWLMNASPFLLWHAGCMQPSSLTELVTEEREEGLAVFRMLRFGDTSHLSRAGLRPSFAARFCETFDEPNERH